MATPNKRQCSETDSPKVERKQFSFKKKREILEAYAKLPKNMSKGKAAGQLNITRPLLYKLLNEKDKILSLDTRNSDMKRARSGKDAMLLSNHPLTTRTESPSLHSHSPAD